MVTGRFGKLRRPVTWAVLGVLVIVAAVGLWLFQPWKLWVVQTVDEALPEVSATSAAADPAATPSPTTPPPPSPTTGPTVLSRGTFVTHEHDTSGAAEIIRLADGQRVLALRGLNTSNGPDLRVWLTDQPVKPGRAGWHVFDDGVYVELGRLKGNRGDQAYALPTDLDLAKYRSVTIWCKRFSVSFGAAELRAVS